MSFIAKFKDAVIGFSGYPRLMRDRTGGFGYVSLLLLIVVTISAVINTVQFKRIVDQVGQRLAKEPDFYLQNGRFVYTGPMPQRFQFENGVLIIDTTGGTQIEQVQRSGQDVLLITSDKLYRADDLKTQITEFSSIPMDIRKEDVLRFISNAYWVVPVGYAFVYLGQVAFKALDGVLLALLAIWIGQMLRRKVSFEQGFRVGLYAMSLPIVIQWLWPGFTVMSGVGFLLWWGIAIIYVIMGLRAYLASEGQPPGEYEV